MKVHITVGVVSVEMLDIDLSKRQIAQLLQQAGKIAIELVADATDSEATSSGQPLGFTAHLELDPDRNSSEDMSEWFEESP